MITNRFDPEPPLARSVYTEVVRSSLDLTDQYYIEDINVLVPEELASQWDAIRSLHGERSTDITHGTKPTSAFDEFMTKRNQVEGDKLVEYLKEKLG